MTTTPSGMTPNRRTVVKGIAWTVPAVAVAGAAPAFAGSIIVPPPPSVNWGGACATTGNGEGCSSQKFALQVPIFLTNPNDEDLLFVVEGAWSANSGNPPADMPAPGGNGSGLGFYGQGSSASNCTTLTPPTECSNISPIASPSSKILVSAGESLTVWYAFNSTNNNASSFEGKVWYTWYDPATCEEVGAGGTAHTATAIEPRNCHNLSDAAPPTAGTLVMAAQHADALTVHVTGATDDIGLHDQPYSFRWRPEGGTWSDWSEWQGSTDFALTGLTPGRYEFQHRVRDAAAKVTEGTAIFLNTVGYSSAQEEAPQQEAVEQSDAPQAAEESVVAEPEATVESAPVETEVADAAPLETEVPAVASPVEDVQVESTDS